MISMGDFVRRFNQDTTIDLICTHCFQTVATGRSDDQALAIAQRHQCLTPLLELEESEEEYIDSQRGTF
jgi:hypothetical protein